jgi:hypothetical protein
VPRDASGQPPSFHYRHCDIWARWVLERGLPALPTTLGADDEVPVTYWAGPAVGTVLFRSWWSRGDDDAGVEGGVNNDHYSYVRTDAEWRSTGGGGVTAGPEEDPMQARHYPDRFAAFFGDWQDGCVRGASGAVGRSAQTIELADRHGVTRRRVDAPLGLVVVCFDADDEVAIRVLDQEDRALLEVTRTPGRW